KLSYRQRYRGFESRPLRKEEKKCVSEDEAHFFSSEKKLPPKLPPSISERINEMAKSIPKYKDPKIVKAKRGWFIALYYENPNALGSYKRFEISGGVNRIKDLAKREK